MVWRLLQDKPMEYKLKVYPNSTENKIISKENCLEVYVKEKPVNNKANIALINLLSRYFKTNSKNIQLKGLNSKNKIVKINTTPSVC